MYSNIKYFLNLIKIRKHCKADNNILKDFKIYMQNKLYLSVVHRMRYESWKFH